MGFDPLRSAREDTIYRHAMRRSTSCSTAAWGRTASPDGHRRLERRARRDRAEGRGESVWLGFFLYSILDRMIPVVEKVDGPERGAYYAGRLGALKDALESTWRGDRYLRAFHDDGTEIGLKGSGIWEIDAPDGGLGRDVGDQPGAGPDRLRDRPGDARDGEDDPPGLAAAARGLGALPRAE
jgi:cyclic beta-1,2-glucan synthetase